MKLSHNCDLSPSLLLFFISTLYLAIVAHINICHNSNYIIMWSYFKHCFKITSFIFFTLRLKLAYIHYTLCSPQTLTVMRLQLPELSQHQEPIIKGAGQDVQRLWPRPENIDCLINFQLMVAGKDGREQSCSRWLSTFDFTPFSDRHAPYSMYIKPPKKSNLQCE